MEDDSFCDNSWKCNLALPFPFPISIPPLVHHPRQLTVLPRQFPRSILPLAPPAHIVRHLHSSIVSTASRFFTIISEFLSQNSFLNKLDSLSSHFHTFCRLQQVECRKLRSLGNHSFAAILPGDSVAGLVVGNGINNFLNIYNTLLVVRLVLTWFPNTPPAIVSPLSTLCDPYLNIFRGIIPPLGGTLDLSPILAFVVLNAFTSAAAALPAELPSSPPSPLNNKKK